MELQATHKDLTDSQQAQPDLSNEKAAAMICLLRVILIVAMR